MENYLVLQEVEERIVNNILDKITPMIMQVKDAVHNSSAGKISEFDVRLSKVEQKVKSESRLIIVILFFLAGLFIFNTILLTRENKLEDKDAKIENMFKKYFSDES